MQKQQFLLGQPLYHPILLPLKLTHTTIFNQSEVRTVWDTQNYRHNSVRCILRNYFLDLPYFFCLIIELMLIFTKQKWWYDIYSCVIKFLSPKINSTTYVHILFIYRVTSLFYTFKTYQHFTLCFFSFFFFFSHLSMAMLSLQN